MIKFTKMPEYDLQVGSQGNGRHRIIIIQSNSSMSRKMERVTGTNIIIVGVKARKELTRVIKEHGRPYINKHNLITGAPISSSTMTSLRRYLL